MAKAWIRGILGSAWLLVMCAGVRAEADWRQGFDIGAGMQYTSMSEIEDGNRVVHETGFLPGLTGGLFTQNDHWRLTASGNAYTGDLNYDGQSRNMITGKDVKLFSSTTQTTYAHAQGEAAWLQGDWEARVFGGYSYWLRSIFGSGDVSSSNENYGWWSLGLGTSRRFALAPGWSINPGLDAWYNFGITQHARSGSLDQVTLHPGGNLGLRVEIPLIWRQSAHADVIVRPYLQAFRFNASSGVPATQNGVPIGTDLFQPQIRYVQPGINLEWEQRL